MAASNKTTKITSSDIFSLYKEYHVPKHVIKHMLKVAAIAGKLCDKLIKKGEKVDKELVVKAALLHDILRVADFKELDLKRFKQEVRSEDLDKWLELRDKYGKRGHVKAGAEILKKLGHPRIANLVAKHAIYEVGNLKTLEEKILFYADKRVQDHRKVRLKTRLKKGRRNDFKEEVIALEKELTGRR